MKSRSWFRKSLVYITAHACLDEFIAKLLWRFNFESNSKVFINTIDTHFQVIMELIVAFSAVSGVVVHNGRVATGFVELYQPVNCKLAYCWVRREKITKISRYFAVLWLTVIVKPCRVLINKAKTPSCPVFFSAGANWHASADASSPLSPPFNYHAWCAGYCIRHSTSITGLWL